MTHRHMHAQNRIKLHIWFIVTYRMWECIETWSKLVHEASQPSQPDHLRLQAANTLSVSATKIFQKTTQLKDESGCAAVIT